MRPVKRFFALAALLCLVSAAAMAQELPEWTYHLSPEITANRQGYLTLANRDHLLAKDYVPGDLTDVTARHTNDFQLRREANDALNAMFAAAGEEQGYTLYVKSGYRSYQTQNTMYYNRLENLGRDDGVVAYPGSSDHQTGLGVDILNYAWMQKDGMTEAFGETGEARWMAANCARFGFILRYPKGKEEITGIIYEPWHFRYVGVEAAAYIMQNGLTLEEFDAERKAAIAAYELSGVTLDELVRQRAMPGEELVVSVSETDGDSEVSIFYRN